MAATLDVTDPDALQTGINQVIEEHGRTELQYRASIISLPVRSLSFS